MEKNNFDLSRFPEHLGRGGKGVYLRDELQKKKDSGAPLSVEEQIELESWSMTVLPNRQDLLTRERAGTLSPEEAATLASFREFKHVTEDAMRELVVAEKLGTITTEQKKALEIVREAKKQNRQMNSEEAQEFNKLIRIEPAA